MLMLNHLALWLLSPGGIRLKENLLKKKEVYAQLFNLPAASTRGHQVEKNVKMFV